MSATPTILFGIETEYGIARDGVEDYLAAVKELCDLSTPEHAALVADWEDVLNDLEADPLRCRDRLDWVAKLALKPNVEELLKRMKKVDPDQAKRYRQRTGQ